MGGVTGTDVCPVCGEEYRWCLDTRTLEYTKISACKCDRLREDAIEFLKSKGLYEEFLRFHEEREKERKLPKYRLCGEEYYEDELIDGLCYVCSELGGGGDDRER